MFRYFKHRRERRQAVQALYEKAVAQVLLPEFYTHMGVKDDFTGHFDLLCLHIAMIMKQLQASRQEVLIQPLFDIFFKSMEENLREQGVGDLGVLKHMKRMMQGFNGRRQSYWQALEQGQSDKFLKQTVLSNIYGRGECPSDTILSNWIIYIKEFASLPVAGDFPIMMQKGKEKNYA